MEFHEELINRGRHSLSLVKDKGVSVARMQSNALLFKKCKLSLLIICVSGKKSYRFTDNVFRFILCVILNAGLQGFT